VFSTGHLGRAEVWAVVRAARERGVERILMTHVQNYTRATAQEIRELCEETGAYAEVITHNLAELEDEAIVALVRGIGPEHVAYGTDAGVLISQKPSVSYLYAVGIMLGAGLIEAEVRRITAQNQALLLDL
jgi:predicted TIM-barrel fold metal-dependent hydrolase